MNIEDIATAIFVFLTLVVIFKITLGIIFRFFIRLTKLTESEMDDLLLEGLSLPLNLLVVVIALSLSLVIFTPDGIFGYPNELITKVGIIIVVTVAFERILKVVSNFYLTNIATKTATTLDDEYIPLLRDVGGIIIYLIGVIIILSEFGIDIAPIIAGLGIAGLAVALALQDTLTNFFAGVHIFVDKPFKRGDLIELAGLGTSTNTLVGRVESVGWRTTKIRDFQNNIYVIPNSKVAQTTIKNFQIESGKGTLAILEVGVAYGNDIDKVRDVLVKAGKAVQKREEYADKDREVEARFDKFSDSSIIFKLFIPIVDFKYNFKAIHKAAKEVVQQFKKEGIEIPFPQLDVRIKEGKI